MSELFKLGVEEASKLIAKGEITSKELVQSVIDRVRAENEKIGAYLTFDEEGAIASAQEADKAIQSGNTASPLRVNPSSLTSLPHAMVYPFSIALSNTSINSSMGRLYDCAQRQLS